MRRAALTVPVLLLAAAAQPRLGYHPSVFPAAPPPRLDYDPAVFAADRAPAPVAAAPLRPCRGPADDRCIQRAGVAAAEEEPEPLGL